MKPLSIWNYYRNNKRKFISLFIIIFLAIFLVCLARMITGSLFYATYSMWVKPKEYLSLVTPPAQDKFLDGGLAGKIGKQDSVDKIVPVILLNTQMINNLGGNSDTNVYSVKQADIESLMKSMHLRIKEGRIPAAASGEIIIHWRIAANKKLKVGDSFGSYINKNEKLTGKYKVVGLLEGDPIVSFTSMEDTVPEAGKTADADLYKYGMLVFPKEGQLDKLNDYLDTIAASEAYVSTYKTSDRNYHRAMDILSLSMTILVVMLNVILSISIGLVCYIYFFQRRSEFGILYAIGYTHGSILKKAFYEITGISTAAFVSGIFTAAVCGSILNGCIYMSKGQPLEIMKLSYITGTLAIPVCIILFSFIPVWRMLNKIDPISIIEGTV